MVKKLTNFIKSNPQLGESFFSLSFLNGINFILPLISLPYLVRVIGPGNFGIYSFIIVISQYCILISTFGFGLSGTKFISEHRDDLNVVTRNFNSIIFIRLILAIFSIVVLLILVELIPSMKHERMSYLFSLGIILGDVFIPVWFFQGMEKMRYLTILNLASKGLFTILIFFIIRTSDDYPLLLLLNSLGYISAALISMVIIRYRFNVRFLLPYWSDIIYQLNNSLHLFLSTVSMSLYRNANIFILGLLTSDYVVGIYASAEKLIKAIQSLVSPVSEALFPYMSRKFSLQKKNINLRNLYTVSKIYFIGLFLLTIIVFFSSKILLRLIYGDKFIDSLTSMRVLSFIILFGGMNYLLGIIGLINLGNKKAFTAFVLISGIINVIITLSTATKLGYIGASFAMLAGELVLFLLCVNKLVSLKRIHA
jgi:polysaccharide transporter, PST family